MPSISTIKTYTHNLGLRSIVESKKTSDIHGINPVVTCLTNGKRTELSRYNSVEMIQAKVMNNIAKTDLYKLLSNKTNFPKAEAKDVERLTSTSLDSTYNRAVWINPKDKKGYYLLDEGITKSGNQKLRILNSDGVFVKNATVGRKTVILSDLVNNIPIIDTHGSQGHLNHTDIVNIVARRYNPFAKYKTIQHEKPSKVETFKQMQSKIDDNTSCISCSYGEETEMNPRLFNKPNVDRMYAYKQLLSMRNGITRTDAEKEVDNVLKRTRLLYSAGNDGENFINNLLAHSGVEGVGGLDSVGNISKHSSSVDTIFTQHYEQYKFPVTTTKEGINITGLKGTDYPFRHHGQVGELIQTFSGTSFSAPIRAAKLALNDMMEGVL